MTLATADVDFLRGLVAKHSGNVIAQRQINMLEQRLTPLAEDVGLNDPESLVAELRRTHDPSLSVKVAEAVTVNETSFFRDMHVFQALQSTVLPEVIQRNEKTKDLRIWCAACSTGQEPYSLAMVIRENFPHLSNWNIRIIATDLSESVLEKSKSGEYSQMEVNRGLPIKKLVRFFDRQGTTWRAKSEVRDLIEFRRMNLLENWSLIGKYDLVLIRNVLIYFDQATKANILTRVRSILKPEGVLFIGSAETIIGLGVPFERHPINGTTTYRAT